MYDTTELLPPNREDILKLIDPYDIYVQYLGYRPVIGQLYTSPLRQDSNPSFGIFYAKPSNKLLFKDFGTGESGDCFKFASLVEGVSSREINKVIYDQYVSKKLPKKSQAKPLAKRKSNVLDIVIDDIPLTAEGLSYWQRYGISQDTLKKYNVKQIHKFWVNGVEYWRASKDKPMFAYIIFDKMKIYRPFFKRMKFYSSCTSADIQGWEQLDYSNDTVYITKSMKDVMLLHELGYSAVAPNGEGHALNKKAVEILRKRFKNIVLLYDRDLPGLLATRKIWNQHRDFDFLFMPRGTQKDLSDFYEANGREITEKLLSDYEKDKLKFPTNAVN